MKYKKKMYWLEEKQIKKVDKIAKKYKTNGSAIIRVTINKIKAK